MEAGEWVHCYTGRKQADSSKEQNFQNVKHPLCVCVCVCVCAPSVVSDSL